MEPRRPGRRPAKYHLAAAQTVASVHDDTIATCAAIDLIALTAVGDDEVSTSPPEEHVATGPRPYLVGAAAARDDVVAEATADVVSRVAAADHVRAGLALQAAFGVSRCRQYVVAVVAFGPDEVWNPCVRSRDDCVVPRAPVYH